ncbi:MAG: putative rane protein [Subtercola sp.]|nr:putative rane protein [Subtercola sp.]
MTGDDDHRGRGRGRFPHRVFGQGSEPDARFTLANERTFLAWIRTSLALIAGGVALEALDLPMQPGLRLAASLVLVLAGILAPLQAWFGWARVEQAMRLGRALPGSVLTAPLAVVVSVVGLLLLLGYALR